MIFKKYSSHLKNAHVVEKISSWHLKILYNVNSIHMILKVICTIQKMFTYWHLKKMFQTNVEDI